MINGLVRPGDRLNGSVPDTIQLPWNHSSYTDRPGDCSELPPHITDQSLFSTLCGNEKKVLGAPQLQVCSKAKSKCHHSKSHTWLFTCEGTVLDGISLGVRQRGGVLLWMHIHFGSTCPSNHKRKFGVWRDLILLVICNTLDLRFFLTEAAV